MPTVLHDEGPQLTGRPGVCLVTSGPGTGNLVAGAATATTEGDPSVAIGGVAPCRTPSKQTHQSVDSVAVMKPVKTLSVAMDAPDAECSYRSRRTDAENISKARIRNMSRTYGIRPVG